MEKKEADIILKTKSGLFARMWCLLSLQPPHSVSFTVATWQEHRRKSRWLVQVESLKVSYYQMVQMGCFPNSNIFKCQESNKPKTLSASVRDRFRLHFWSQKWFFSCQEFQVELSWPHCLPLHALGWVTLPGPKRMNFRKNSWPKYRLWWQKSAI